MKLKQLHYIVEISNNELNVSQTAQKLFTSQPGISKQVRMLEDELGVEIFARSGKHLVDVTPAGRVILTMAKEMLLKSNEIKRVAQEFKHESKGGLSIGVTHTQARYVLPPIIQKFIGKFPDVKFDMHQGTPQQIAQMAADGSVDFAVATEAVDQFPSLVMLPSYRWNRCIVVPKGHPLVDVSYLTLKDIAKHPIVTYVFGFTGRSKLDDAFAQAGLEPNVVCTAADADVIKTYVRLGLGVGILAGMAFDADKDSDLVALDASKLFDSSITKICFRRGIFMRSYMYEFLELFAEHLTRDRVDLSILKHHSDNPYEHFDLFDLPLK